MSEIKATKTKSKGHDGAHENTSSHHHSSKRQHQTGHGHDSQTTVKENKRRNAMKRTTGSIVTGIAVALAITTIFASEKTQTGFAAVKNETSKTDKNAFTRDNSKEITKKVTSTTGYDLDKQSYAKQEKAGSKYAKAVNKTSKIDYSYARDVNKTGSKIDYLYAGDVNQKDSTKTLKEITNKNVSVSKTA